MVVDDYVAVKVVVVVAVVVVVVDDDDDDGDAVWLLMLDGQNHSDGT